MEWPRRFPGHEQRSSGLQHLLGAERRNFLERAGAASKSVALRSLELQRGSALEPYVQLKYAQRCSLQCFALVLRRTPIQSAGTVGITAGFLELRPRQDLMPQ